MNRNIVIVGVIGIVFVAAIAFVFFGDYLPLGRRGGFGDWPLPGDKNFSDFADGNFDRLKEPLGLPGNASNEDVLAALGLDANASPEQIREAIKGIIPNRRR